MRKQKVKDEQTILHKFKNRKFDLDVQQKREKNLSENKNLMKASKINFKCLETTTNKLKNRKFLSLNQYQISNVQGE